MQSESYFNGYEGSQVPNQKKKKNEEEAKLKLKVFCTSKC
jgi:hypothetical protein